MPEVEVTEIDALETARVDAVVRPASGIPFLMLKSLAKELDGEQTQDERYEKVNAALKIDVFGDADDLDERWLYIRDLSDTRLVYRDPEDESILWKREYSMTDGDDPVVTFGDKVQVVEEYKEVGDEGDGAAGDAEKGASGEDDPEVPAPVPNPIDPDVEKAEGGDMGGNIETGPETPGEPGSPEWEAADAEALTAVATELARLAARLGISLDRERMEYSAGEADDWQDIDAISYAVDCVNTALNLVAGLSFREAVEGETESAEKSIRPETIEAFTKARDALSVLLGDTPAEEATMDLPTMTDLVKNASDDDATDEQKAQVTAFREALGLDGVMTKEETEAEITKSSQASEERIAALEAELEEVKKAAAPGGPVKTRTTEQQTSADQVDVLKAQAHQYRELADNVVDDRDLRTGYLAKAREVDEQLAKLTSA
jgi:hypothetical protein